MLQHNANAACGMSLAEELTIAREAVTTRLADLLGIAADDIDSDGLVLRYGVGSLVVGELRNWMIKTFGLELAMLQSLNKCTKIEYWVRGVCCNTVDGYLNTASHHVADCQTL